MPIIVFGKKGMKSYFDYLKQKWGIESNFQFWLIFTIFGISGTSTLFVKEPIFKLFGVEDQTAFWIKFLIYIITIAPAYFLFLFLYGTVLGQFRFFRRFIRDFFLKIFFIRKQKKQAHLVSEKSTC